MKRQEADDGVDDEPNWVISIASPRFLVRTDLGFELSTQDNQSSTLAVKKDNVDWK